VVGCIGVTGFAGSGKTTAVKYLSRLTGGREVYLGKTVLDEVRARGLSDTRDSERLVRIDLRRRRGPGALAIPRVDEIAECFGNRIPVFIDAIFTQQEFDILASRVPSGCARLLAINASFDIRRERLARRSERPFNTEQLRERDNTELELGTAAVISVAGYTIRNEGTLDEYYRELEAFVSWCG
jgi:dephospho-CoA kinase